jgi:hypothetical protein
MTKAEFLTARGLRDVLLPSAGITVTVRKPKTLDLFRAGLFPLKISKIELDKIDPDEKEQMLKEADRTAVRLICECAVEPKIVNRKARPGEVRIDALDDEDFQAIYQGILDLIEQEQIEPPQEPHSSYDTHMRNLAAACKCFGLDPTEAIEWEPERVQMLEEFALMTIKKDGPDGH